MNKYRVQHVVACRNQDRGPGITVYPFSVLCCLQHPVVSYTVMLDNHTITPSQKVINLLHHYLKVITSDNIFTCRAFHLTEHCDGQPPSSWANHKTYWGSSSCQWLPDVYCCVNGCLLFLRWPPGLHLPCPRPHIIIDGKQCAYTFCMFMANITLQMKHFTAL